MGQHRGKLQEASIQRLKMLPTRLPVARQGQIIRLSSKLILTLVVWNA